MVSTHSEEVANWHFSADPKPVDMIWGSIAFPAFETPLNFIERGPVRQEYAAPWRHSDQWRNAEVFEERRQEINQALVAATFMWIQSLHHTGVAQHCLHTE